MDPLRARTELACVHVLDHALAQRADRNRTHWQLLSWMRLTTPQSSRHAAQVAIDDLSLGYRPRGQAPRFSGLSRSDLVLWPKGLAAMAGRRVRSLGYSCRTGQSAGTTLLTRFGHLARRQQDEAVANSAAS